MKNKLIILVAMFIIAIMMGACAPTAPAADEHAPAVTEPAPTEPAKTEQKEIHVGVMAPQSGDVAVYGKQVIDAVKLRAEESDLNIKLTIEDTQCDGKAATNAMNKLTTVNKVQVVIGEVCSGASLAAAPIAQEKKVVMISPASTSPDLTNAGEYFFRSIPSDALQGEAGAKLVSQRGYKTLAILHSNDDYGVGFMNVLRDEAEALNVDVVDVRSFNRGDVDIRTQLTKIKQANPDALYLIGNAPDSSVAALQQIKELGINAQLFGSEAFKSEDMLDNAGEEMDGMIVSSVSTGAEWFKEKYKAKYNEDADPFAPQAYDAMTAVVMALESGARTGEQIKNAMMDVSFDGATGPISFDENGEVPGIYELYEVEQGEFVKVN